MVVLPAGSFMMGSNEEASPADRRPQHQVTTTNPFAAGKYEVTLAEWQTCVEAGACPPYDWSGLSDMPMGKITWDETIQYVTWLSRVTARLIDCFPRQNGNMQSGPERRRSIHSGRMRLNCMTTLGTRTMPRAEHTSRVC